MDAMLDELPACTRMTRPLLTFMRNNGVRSYPQSEIIPSTPTFVGLHVVDANERSIT